MNEKWKPSRLLASLLAFVAFVGSFATLALMFIIGAALPGYARAELDAGQHVQDSLLAGVAAILGLGLAVFVYRIARHRISWTVLFHACFFIGITLLGYCLWAVLTLFPILDSSVLNDWSAHILQATFSCPIICLFVIPVALFLLAFATFHDNNRNA